jgi:hypothetical protein
MQRPFGRRQSVRDGDIQYGSGGCGMVALLGLEDHVLVRFHVRQGPPGIR